MNKFFTMKIHTNEKPFIKFCSNSSAIETSNLSNSVEVCQILSNSVNETSNLSKFEVARASQSMDSYCS